MTCNQYLVDGFFLLIHHFFSPPPTQTYAHTPIELNIFRLQEVDTNLFFSLDIWYKPLARQKAKQWAYIS